MSKRAKDAINDIKHLTEIQGSDHAPILLDLDVWFTDDELVEEWKQTDWILAEKILEQHQQALTRAMIERNFDKIAKIQSALVNHPLIKRMAVRQVGERTNTAGIDNVRWYTASAKMRVAKRLNKKPYKASPLRQIILVDKGSGKQRSIGILTMYDRAMHKLYSFALAPLMETTSEQRSFGFRRGRSTFDLHEQIKKC